MSTKLLFILFISSLIFPLSAQKKMSLIPYRNGEKFGFCTSDKKLVIPCKYDEVSLFNEDLAAVKSDEYWGVINKKGDVVVQIEYSSIDFAADIIIARKGDDFSIYSKTGKPLNKLTKKYDWFDSANHPSFIIITQNNKYGIVNSSGAEIVSPKYDFLSSFNNDMARFKLNDKWGYINNSGKEVIPPIYDDAENFIGNLAVVKLNNLAGVINKQNNRVIPFKEENSSITLNDNIIIVRNYVGDYVHCNIYDQSGKELLALKGNYLFISDFNEGIAAVSNEEEKYFLDLKGNKLFNFTSRDFLSFKEGLIAIQFRGFWGFMDKTGKFVIAPEYELASSFSEGLAKVLLEDQTVGFIDKKGKVIFTINEPFALVSDIKDGYAIIYGGKEGPFIYGVVNRDGTKYWAE